MTRVVLILAMAVLVACGGSSDKRPQAPKGDPLAGLEGQLGKTLALVISKSGGTPETRNGMLEAKKVSEPNAPDIPITIFKAGEPFSVGPFSIRRDKWLPGSGTENWYSKSKGIKGET